MYALGEGCLLWLSRLEEKAHAHGVEFTQTIRVSGGIVFLWQSSDNGQYLSPISRFYWELKDGEETNSMFLLIKKTIASIALIKKHTGDIAAFTNYPISNTTAVYFSPGPMFLLICSVDISIFLHYNLSVHGCVCWPWAG